MAGTPGPLTFSTRGVALPARRGVLRTLLEHGFMPVEPLPDAAPAVELVKWWLPGASVLSGTFAGVRQIGDPGTGDAAEDLFVSINVSGASLATQRGRQVPARAGEAVVVDLHSGPFTVLRPTPSRVIGIRVPRRALPVRDADAPRLLPAHTPALQLLTRYLHSLVGGPAPNDPQLAEAVAGHIAELITLSLSPAVVSADGPSVRAARIQAIRADIDRHLTDPSLTPAAVAARHGITTRYLHRLFESDGQTYSRYVLDRRLELTHRLLRNPRLAARTISAIACDAGFGDLSYFNRTFRRRFHATPSEIRAR